MHTKDSVETDEPVVADEPDGSSLLMPLVSGQSARRSATGSLSGVVLGELIAVTGDGLKPMVAYPGQKGSAAVVARTIVDLHSDHVGRHVVLMFEDEDLAKPIVLGVMREPMGWEGSQTSEAVEADVDGERLVISAKKQLVLRCGKASITLTKAGKILIQGEYIASRSSGVHRIKGGSVQLN